MRNPKGCWWQCAAAALALFCTIGLNINIFSVYLPYLTKILELTHNQSSNLLTIRSVLTLCTVYAAKYYYEKLDIKLGYTLAMLLATISLWLNAIASSFGVLCIAAIISGICYGLGGMYPVAILIHRWFPKHESLAMGICAASSGLALTVGAPAVTNLIERYSLRTAMLCEVGFLILATVICFVLLRNYPNEPLHFAYRGKAARNHVRLNILFLAIMAVGVLGGAFSFVSIHYTTEGFNPYQVSTIISIIGACLIGAKFLLGELFDLWGGYRTNWLFLPIALLSCILFSLGNGAGFTMALAAACLYGVGDSVATVGITVYAKDLSKPAEYAATQQQFQFANMLGNLVSTFISGPIATVTGNYRGFYLIVTVLIVFAIIVLQSAYKKKQGNIY